MKINLSEIKIWGDIKYEFNNILNYCIENWNETSVKSSIEWNTLVSYKFIKKDIIDLKEIEMFDEYLFEEATSNFLKSFIMKESENSNVRIDTAKISLLTEEEIIAMYDDNISSGDNKKTIYYKSLKAYGLINQKGEIDIAFLSKNTNVRKFYTKCALDAIKNYGIDWDADLLNSLIKLNIIVE